jgi:hypothetical protein
MTTPKSVRHILEILNKNKQDLLVLLDQIANQAVKYSDSINSLGIDFPEDNKNLNKFIASSNLLIDFWGNVHNLTGGLRFQEAIYTLLDSNKRLRIDLNEFGIFLLRSNQAKPHSVNPPILSLQEESWLELVSLLRLDLNFIKTAKSIRILQIEREKLQISQDLQNIFSIYTSLSSEDKEEYSAEYGKTRIPIDEFLKTKYPNKEISPSVNIKNAEQMEGDTDFDNYSAYLEADERELARMKRTGNYTVRKRGNKRKRSNS